MSIYSTNATRPDLGGYNLDQFGEDGWHFLPACGNRPVPLLLSRPLICSTPPDRRKVTMNKLLIALLFLTCGAAHGQAWRNCVPNSIGPGGCNSIGPGGGQSIGPGGGRSIGPGGGLSIGPGGGQSIGPNGGQSIGPGGGQALDRDRTRGLDTNTMRPFDNGFVSPPPNFGAPQPYPFGGQGGFPPR